MQGDAARQALHMASDPLRTLALLHRKAST